jgi:hypothetical protein
MTAKPLKDFIEVTFKFQGYKPDTYRWKMGEHGKWTLHWNGGNPALEYADGKQVPGERVSTHPLPGTGTK